MVGTESKVVISWFHNPDNFGGFFFSAAIDLLRSIILLLSPCPTKATHGDAIATRCRQRVSFVFDPCFIYTLYPPTLQQRNTKPRVGFLLPSDSTCQFTQYIAITSSSSLDDIVNTTKCRKPVALVGPLHVACVCHIEIVSLLLALVGQGPYTFSIRIIEIVSKSQFKAMMEDIQQAYKSRKPETSVIGAPVIGLFPEDNVLYRAQVLEVVGSQYKVYYVDFGNVSTVSKVWPIEKKFMNLPAQAIICGVSGIGPQNGQWPNTDNYSKYFDKDMFICKFINKDEDKGKCRTYVDLFYGDDAIAQQLVKDGLAVSTQQTIPEIEIPLLLGQQFRAIVKSINNLSDIIIMLECGVALSCKMHNIEQATETFEDTLKGLLEQTVIIFVDNVVDNSLWHSLIVKAGASYRLQINYFSGVATIQLQGRIAPKRSNFVLRLEITLYDSEGSKITILNPDEEAYDSVDALCPPLILCSIVTGYVSYADESSVYIQPSEYTNTLATLVDQMFECYDGHNQDLPIIPEEGLLYSVHSEDGNWYRGRVNSFDDEHATVVYIDYGNSEKVVFSSLRELNDNFLEICTLCVQVIVVNSPTDHLLDKEVIAKISYGENGWEGTVEVKSDESSATESAQAERGESVEVSATQTVEDVVVEEVSVVQDTAVQESAVCSDAYTEAIQDASTESTFKGTQVIASHVDSPNEFYLQLSESLAAIDELQLNLQTQALEMPVLENPTAGVLCAAPYSADLQWYRAEVLDADDDITTVRFVDYGNTDVIVNKTTKVKTLPPNLLSLAVYATRSSLKVKSEVDEWSSSALTRFETLVNSENLSAEFVDQDEKMSYVELYSNGENIKDILIRENLALPMELSVDSKSTGFVSHINSPSEFWIQLENCVEELEWIAEQLSGAEDFLELDDLTPGTLCAALFPDDEMWYRARILSNTIAGIELLFVDYGNSCMSNSLRQLPEELVVTPPLAQKCSLQKPDGITYWTPEAVNKFQEMAAEGQTIFTVRKISTGETSTVQLFIDEQDLTTILRPTTEKGSLKEIQSLDSLSIEKDGEVLSENYKLESMPGMTYADDSKNKLEELSNQVCTLLDIVLLIVSKYSLLLDHTGAIRILFDSSPERRRSLKAWVDIYEWLCGYLHTVAWAIQNSQHNYICIK
ncbi:hypothetical protein NQ317_001098 [Molorchus minor]|uniref:Tudor domain-containing protein n=1 Tax=Molorchus minor TaxID=1323400 RepID=A0ABQ9IY42_9CUCU|nr:hypothetical protein NQ317_001098 [Molorchus minor]